MEIVAKRGLVAASEHVSRLAAWLKERGIEPLFESDTAALASSAARGARTMTREELPNEVDLVIVLGGDGTLLAMAARIAQSGRDIPILGVNFGSLGFLTEVTLPGLYPSLESVLNGTARVEEGLVAGLYQSLRDSLRGDGYRVRYALVDTAGISPPEPTIADLDRYYRAHLADYSSYQRETGAIVEAPFSDVQADVRRRWKRERLRELARAAADRLQETWRRGRSDPAVERTLAVVRGPEVVPAFGDVDTGHVASALKIALEAAGGQRGVTVTPIPSGTLVLDLQETVRDYVPTLAQVRTFLLAKVEALKQDRMANEARRAFEVDSTAYRSRSMIHFSRLIVAPPPVMEVPLSREEVERYYREHINEYSVEDLSRVRHILVATSGRGALPDAQARAKAEELLARIRRGEDFAKLAAEHSDDEPTRKEGGDLGMFRRGMMREPFERAAFAMRPGDIAGPVRTDAGYHILECLEYQPPVFHPLVEVYSNVSYDCANRKSKRIADERADSLYRTLKSVAQAKAVAARHGFLVMSNQHEVGTLHGFDAELIPYIRKVEKLKPGQFYPGFQRYEGLGSVITWVDSVYAPRARRWDEIRGEAVERYRQERAMRALNAKRAELDSMMAAGWTLDSLATLWGGLERLEEVEAGAELRGMGGRALLDSLAFGLPKGPALETGKVSGWIEFPGGLAKMRVTSRIAPDPSELARRIEVRRQLVLWRNLKAYFDRLKGRYPVEILDGDLRATELIEPSES